jgi:hypothetical protein
VFRDIGRVRAGSPVGPRKGVGEERSRTGRREADVALGTGRIVRMDYVNFAVDKLASYCRYQKRIGFARNYYRRSGLLKVSTHLRQCRWALDTESDEDVAE